MKNWLAVLVLSSAVAASAQALPTVLPDVVPAPQEVVTCGPLQQTALYTVGGSTCIQATNDLHGFLTGVGTANCVCGLCSQQFVDKACQVITGGYSVSGYMKYRCRTDCPPVD